MGWVVPTCSCTPIICNGDTSSAPPPPPWVGAASLLTPPPPRLHSLSLSLSLSHTHTHTDPYPLTVLSSCFPLRCPSATGHPPTCRRRLGAPPLIRMSRAGDDLLELLWDNHGPALRTPFQPFTCSAAGSTRAHELHRTKRHAAMDVPVSQAAAGDDDDDAVPWLHCPVIDDGDSDTAPLPPEFCAGLLPPALHAAVPDPTPPPTASDATQPLPGEGVMNFTFFSRPLQRPPQAAPSNPLESSAVQTAASRLRSTPLFSEQRMAWLQPPRATPPAPQAPPATDDHHHHRHHVEVEAATAATLTQQQQQQHRLFQAQPDARTAAAVTTSSVCSGNGDRSHSHQGQAGRSSHCQQQLTAECSVSQDEDMDDEPGGAARRSAARGTKRSRTAEVHNLSERRRRDRINEKMRALQELIPNCNKIDKASMLEEAIEYLKTLQLQVQMMSMGTGLYMPPAMLMQMQVHTPMAPFPHLGMGLGFGMGPAFDMLPRFAAQFPCPAVMPGAPPMFGMPGGQFMGPPFPHVSNGAAPAEQTEAAPVPPPLPPGTAASDQHPKQT